MKISFNKNIAVYIFSGLFICFLTTVGFVYSQFKDLGDIKIVVAEEIEKLTGRNVSIGGAEFKFEKGISIRLQQLSIDSLNGEDHEFLAKSAWCVVKFWPLLNKEIEIKKFIVEGVSIKLVRDKQGKFNFGNSLRWLPNPIQGGLFKVLGTSFAHRLSVSDSEVRFLDYYNVSGPDPISILVNNISITINKRFFQNVFSFNLSGEIPNKYQTTVFELSGGIDNLRDEKGDQPIPVQGKVKVRQFHLAQLRPYLKNALSAVPNDTWLSLESDFSGALGAKLRSEGKLKYSSAMMEQKPILSSMDSPNEGEMEYSFVLDNDSLKIQDLKLRSGPISFSGRGKLTGFKSQDPTISFAVQTGEFKVGETRHNLPLMLFPESAHKELTRVFDNGTLRINSFQFDGSLKQFQNLELKENKNSIAAEIVFKGVDWRSPLPPLENMAGSLKYKNGDGFFEIVKARFEGLPITNIKGTVRSVMNNPLVDLSTENNFELGELNRVLKKSIAGQSFENILDDYREVAGNGLLKIKLQGPLEEPKKISLTGALSIKGASFFDTYLQSRVRNFSGELYFNHVPKENQKQAKSPVPIVVGKNLSGEFGKSEFYNMQGEILRQKENIVQKMQAVYRLNTAELPKIVADIDFSGPLFELFKQAKFEQGDVEVHYRSLMDLDQPQKKKDWGEIKLKNVSIKHPSGFQPLAKLVGEISFGDGRIGINKIEGWYGNSPISVDGQLIPKSRSLVDFDIRATLTDWTQPDFTDIPYFQNLKFAGSINPEIHLVGNRHSFKFKNKLDLTKTSYKFQEAFYKKENIPNKIEMEGTYSEKEGIAVDQLKFILDGNSVTGEAKIKSFVDPEYLIKINGVGFRTKAMASLIDVFKNNRAGRINFDVTGQGNLTQLEDSLFKGSAVLKDLVFEWEDRKNPLTLSADIRFSGNTYDFRAGQLASGRSHLAFSGKLKNSEHPKLLLKLTGKTLAVDELISDKKDDDEVETSFKDIFEKSRLLSSGTSKISVNLGQLDYKWLTLSDVSGRFFLKDREVVIDRLRVGSKKPIKGRGKFSVKDPEAIRFETRLQANKIEAQNLLAMFGDHFRDGLTGKFKKLNLSVKSHGRNLSENIRTLNGKLSIDLAEGTIDTKKLKAGVFDLFDLKIPVENKSKTETDEGLSGYVGISGDFIYIDGIAETENFIYETDQRKSAIVGEFDLNKLKMDTVVGVAHMPGLDKLLRQIPVVGSILTAGDEGSLLKTYYTARGSFDDPEIIAVPLTSIGKKFVGLFQGILQTSGEILDLPSKVGVGKITD